MMRAFIGTKQFYKKLMIIAVPILIQQLISASVQLVDNLMVGSLGEHAIGAISIVNQLFFVVILVSMGLMSGAGIYASQYFGSKDFDKLQQTFAFKIITGLIISGLTFSLFTFFGEGLIRLFTKNPITISLALGYLNIVKFSVFPFVFADSIRSAFRDIGITKPFMYVSFLAIGTNTVLNYLLIFGHFGFSELGVEGAAIATFLSRMVELVVGYIILKKSGTLFYKSIRSLFHIERKVFKNIFILAIPLMTNEFLWSMGQTAYLHAYSTRGDSALAAMNITTVVSQLIFISFMAMGTAAAVMVGKNLGENKLEEAVDVAVKIAASALIFSMFTGMIFFIMSFFIMDIYNISEYTKSIAEFCIRANVFITPFFAYNVVIYFTVRAGGDMKSTMMMDSLFMWIVAVPIAMVLAYLTDVEITWMFVIVQGLEIVKAIYATVIFRRKKWVRNLAVEIE